MGWPIKYRERKITAICEECSEKFVKKQETHKYCSPECSSKKWKRAYKSVVSEGETYSDAVKKKWGLRKQVK